MSDQSKYEDHPTIVITTDEATANTLANAIGNPSDQNGDHPNPPRTTLNARPFIEAFRNARVIVIAAPDPESLKRADEHVDSGPLP